MTRAELVEAMMNGGAFAQPSEAAQALDATLAVLGEVLVPSERRSVARELPPELRAHLETGVHLADASLERFYEHVQRREHAREGRAREHAQLACRALAQAMDPDTLAVLSRHLPELAPLFTIEAVPSQALAPDVLRQPDRANTLATGRPGSKHPIADARPDRAQSGSVARSDDPHGDTKLSGARGLTQEREGETLATGKVGGKRSLSG